MANNYPKCYDKRKGCFARINGCCDFLHQTYKNQDCPFFKERRDETKGKIYKTQKHYRDPWNPTVHYLAVQKHIKKGDKETA